MGQFILSTHHSALEQRLPERAGPTSAMSTTRMISSGYLDRKAVRDQVCGLVVRHSSKFGQSDVAEMDKVFMLS